MAWHNLGMMDQTKFAPPADLKSRLIQQAHAAGFELVGVTTPDPPPHLEIFRSWLAAGRHGAMDYLASERAIERRSDPRQIMPDCRSILVLGANYLPRGALALNPQGNNKIAVYALGDDYHEVLPTRLEALIDWLQSEVQSLRYRIYTDTGPLLERELGMRAGLGWIGKNTCLIHPQRGSFFLLAEVLLDLALEPDEPFTADRCGSCRRCLEACPTACILPDRTLDARRCISYLTIELKTAIPSELRSQTAGWIFGCDICQQVCPWNLRFALPSNDEAFRPRRFLQDAGLETFLTIDEQGFRDALRHSPLKRSKRWGMARNASLAAARDPQFVPELSSTLLEDPHPLPRLHAAWALGELNSPAARRALMRARQGEQDPQVQSAIQQALEQAR